MTSPKSRPLNWGPVLSTAGGHSKSRSRLGADMRSDAMCSKGSSVYCPAANTSSRGPMRGSPSDSDVNGVPLSVPDTSREAGAVGTASSRNMRSRVRPAWSALRYSSAPILACETEKLEEKRAPLGVGRVVPNLDTQGVDCRIELPRLKELSRLHAKRRALLLGVRLDVPAGDDGGARRAVGLLRRVRHVYRTVRKRHRFGGRVIAAARTRPLNRFHEHF